jgi:2-methylcitrate dehydratase PrpD
MENRIEASRALAKYAAELKYEDIPSDVREATKRSILDTLGVAAAGSGLGEAEGYIKFVELIKDGGGKEESTILGFGNRVPAWMAALANGALTRVLHYDDTYDEAVTHPSCTTVPASLAVAERLKNISGKDFITAVTLGNDITSRMGLSICLRPQGWKPDWYSTTVHGVFGAAAACGKLLGLDAEKMQNAFGIALYESAGTLEGPGMSSAFTSKGAVISALMAEKGIVFSKNSLEGNNGLFSVYYGGDYNRDVLISNLGDKFESAGISLKPWPGLRYYHPYFDATLQLVCDNDISVEAIKQITIFVAGYVEMCCQDMELRQNPTTLNEANISLPYLVAVAATKRRVSLMDITPEAIKDPLPLQIARKVVPKHDDRFSISNEIGPAMVEIELVNGKSFSKELKVAYGNPKNPITKEDLLYKFRDCVSHSIKPPTDKNVEQVIEMVARLEEVNDVGRVARLLC